MNKTVSVNIGGLAFIVEENAYQILQSYLANVKSKFSEDEAEIMMDIEARIAELLREKLIDLKEVIEEADIEEVIEIMGQPEDFQDEESERVNQEYAEYVEAESVKRKLYRDTDNAMIGGVCSGLAKYFGVDIIVMRVLFLLFVLFLGSGIFLYIVLLIIIPEAKTTAEKLQMNGEPVNLDSLKAHFNKIGQDINENIKEKQINKKVNTAVNGFIRAIVAILNALGKIIGVAFVIAGVVGLFFVVLYFFGYNDIIPFTSFIRADSFYDFLMVIYSSDLLAKIALVSLIAILIIPLITFIYSGIKMVFDIKSHTYKPLKISLGIIFGICISLLIIVSIRAGINFSNYGENYVSIAENEDVGNTLYVTVGNEDPHLFRSDHGVFGPQYLDIKKDQFSFKNVKIHLKESVDSTGFSIHLIEHSNGINERIAIENAMNIEYDIALKGDTLIVPSYVTIRNKYKYREQGLDIYIHIPKGKIVHFGKGSHKLMNVIYNRRSYYSDFDDIDRIKNTDWINAPDGIDCVNCD